MPKEAKWREEGGLQKTITNDQVNINKNSD
jgi:hypothetical protein